MPLLDAIEEEIGYLGNWPTSILTKLFALDPHIPFTLTHLQILFLFFTALSSLFLWPVNSSLLAASSIIDS
jgi:hypothetical protein